MSSKHLSVVFCLILSGCNVFSPFNSTEMSARSGQSGITTNEVASVPAGSRVIIQHLAGKTQRQIAGTVLQASPHGIALMNCDERLETEIGFSTLNRIPYVSRLVKNTGFRGERVPVLWVSIRDMTSVSVVEPPPPGFVAPQIQIDTNDEPYFERIGVDFNFDIHPSPPS